MSDNRVPVQANVFENLNIGTPDEDQPSPFVNGKELSLVYDLSGFENQGGVLVRRGQTVTVGNTPLPVSGPIDVNGPLGTFQAFNNDRENTETGTVSAPNSDSGTILTGGSLSEVLEVQAISFEIENLNPGNSLEWYVTIRRGGANGTIQWQARNTTTNQYNVRNPNLGGLTNAVSDLFFVVENVSGPDLSYQFDGYGLISPS